MKTFLQGDNKHYDIEMGMLRERASEPICECYAMTASPAKKGTHDMAGFDSYPAVIFISSGILLGLPVGSRQAILTSASTNRILSLVI